MRVATGPSSLGSATVNAPYRAAATLSACPSTSLATRRSVRRSSGSPMIALAATTPPTMAAALDPRPRATGMAERCVTWYAPSVSAAASAAARADTTNRLSSPVGMPFSMPFSRALSSPSRFTDQARAGRRSNSARRGNAMANESKPGPRFALEAGTRTRSSPTATPSTPHGPHPVWPQPRGCRRRASGRGRGPSSRSR